MFSSCDLSTSTLTYKKSTRQWDAQCTSFYQTSYCWWSNRSAESRKILSFSLLISSESDDASWKLRMCRIKRFSKHFFELSQSRKYVWADWLSLIENDSSVNVSFKMLFLQSSSYKTASHWWTFRASDTRTETTHAFSRCRKLLLRLLDLSMLFYICLTRISAF